MFRARRAGIHGTGANTTRDLWKRERWEDLEHLCVCSMPPPSPAREQDQPTPLLPFAVALYSSLQQRAHEQHDQRSPKGSGLRAWSCLPSFSPSFPAGDLLPTLPAPFLSLCISSQASCFLLEDIPTACNPLRSPRGASHHHKYTQTAAGGFPALLPLQRQGCEGWDCPCSHSSRASWSLWGTEALGSHPAGFRLPSRMQLSAKPELSLCTFGISFLPGSPNEGDRVGSGATSGTQGCAFRALLQICVLRQKASAFCHEAIGFSSEI